jgi:hypothetical protein
VREGKQKEITMSAIIKIALHQYAGDLMDGCSATEIAAIDLDKSAERYMTTLAAEVKKLWPQADVTWELTAQTPRQSVIITTDDRNDGSWNPSAETEQAELVIDDIAGEVYGSQAFWVDAA